MMTECDCCNSKVESVRTYGDKGVHEGPRRELQLCYICANSLIGQAFRYNYSDSSLHTSLAFCTNQILNAINSLKP